MLISLAFADLLVGCATTLFVIDEFRLFPLSFVFNILDMFAGLSSIFHLAVISLERFHATLRPFGHRQLSLKAYWVAIATPWILSLSDGISIFTLTWFSLIMERKMLIIVIICLIAPLLITCFSYLLIWREKRKRTLRSFRQNQEAWFSRTIFLVTAASFIAWVPFLYLILSCTWQQACRDLYHWQLFSLSSSFILVTRSSTLLSTLLGFLATEKLCFLYVDPIVSCKSTHQLGTSRPSMHRQPANEAFG